MFLCMQRRRTLKTTPFSKGFLGFIFFLSSLTGAWAADHYVSPSGNDTTGTGTEGSPYLTITKAISVAAAGDTLILRAGTYRELVDITKQLTLRAYKDAQGVPEKVVISALEVVTDWTVDSGNIYKAAMNWELVASENADDDKRGFIQHQVFVNDGGEIKSLVGARWPNINYTKATNYTYDDVAHMAAGSGKKDTTNYIDANTAWFTNDEDHIAMPSTIRDMIAGSLITYQPATMCFSRTNRIPTSGALTNRNSNFANEITIVSEELKADNTSSTSTFDGGYEYPNIGCGYHLWGKKGFLDTAGEWFRQPSGTTSDNGTLYVWMPDGNAPGTKVEAKRRMKTVNIGIVNDAENSADTTLDGIVMEDLTFLGGGICVSRNSDNLTLRRCTFRYTSSIADTRFTYTARWDRRSLLLFSSGATIEDCDFSDTENGIEVNGRNNTVRNCTFHNIGADGLGPAVFANYTTSSLANDGSIGQRNVVEKCTFVASAYSAIALSKGMTIKNNDVAGTHRRGNDTGAVSLGPDVDALGSEVAYNFVRDSWSMPLDTENGKVFYGVHGIYADRDSKNLLVHHNVVWGMTGPELAMLKSGTSGGTSDSGHIMDHNTAEGDISLETDGDTITVRNNLALNSVPSASGLTLSGNLGYASETAGWSDAAAQDYRLLSTSRAIDAGVAISGNPYGAFSGTAPDAGAYEGMASWSTAPGATASDAQIKAATLTADTSPDRTSTDLTLSGLPAGRKLPAGTLAQIGSSSSGGTLVQSVDSETGVVSVTIQGVPTDGNGGNQTVKISPDGGTTWLDMGTANTDGSKVLSTDLPASGIDPSTGATIKLTGQDFVRPTPTTYERSVTIANPANTDLFDYPVLITLDTATMVTDGQCQSDGRDLRFFTSDDTSLPYWIESGMNTSSTRIWVKPPKIPAAGGSITMVSGDSALTAASSGTDVFVFFDDFEDGTLKSDWKGAATQTDSKGNSATIAETGGHLAISGSITSSEIDYGVAFGVNLPTSEPDFYPDGKHIIESRVQVVKSGGATTPPDTGWKASVGGNLSYMGINDGQVAYYNSGWQDQTATTVTDGTAVTVGYAVDPADGTATGSLWFFEDGVQKATRTDQDFVSGSNKPTGRGAWTINPQAVGAFEMQVDDVRVRPWVSAEPTVTVGAPTTILGSPLTVTLNGETVTATWISAEEIQIVIPATTRAYSSTETLAVTCGGVTLPDYNLAWNTGQTPIEQWRYGHWSNIANNGNGANSTDPDNDGIVNLLEYAFGGNPKQSSPSSAPSVGTATVGSYARLTLSFSRNPANTDIDYVVQTTSDLGGTWSDVASSENGAVTGAINSSGVTVSGDTGSGVRTVTITDTTDLGSGTKRFMRIKVVPSP
jgi:parallel beta-helix repeat protein